MTPLEAITAALEAADEHSCHYNEGTDYRALATAVLAAVQGLYVPPPPGSDRDALPEHLRRLIEPQMPLYLSTGCETARACRLATEVFPDHADELRVWERRQHAACRITRKQDMARCQCDCHSAAKES